MKAIGYARISKDDLLEGRGVARQTEDIAEVCDRQGWELLEVLTDNDVSASRYSTKPRDGYARLVEMIGTGAVDRAIIYDLDRLLRQPRELEDLIDLAESNGGFEIHSVTGEVDLRTSSGRFTARVLVSKAAMESDDLSRRLKRAFDQKAAEGAPHGPRAFGYEDDGLTIRESEAALIRQAAADVLDGTASLNAIARRWDDAGVDTPQRAKSWYAESVKAILTGPRGAGLRVHRGEVVGEAAWPAILDRDTHDRLVAHLNRPKRRRPPRRTAFTGLITDVNGVPLDRDVVRGRPTYRGHRRPGREAAQVSISAEPLERYVVAMLLEAIDAGELGRVAGEAQARREAAPDLAAIEDDLRALAADHGAGRISRAEWLAARAPLQARLEAAQVAVDTGPTAAVAAELTADLRERWDGLDVDRQRDILSTAFEAIVIHPSARKGGPAPMVEGIGRLEVDRVDPRWRA